MISFKKGDNIQITAHFNSKEFECSCSKCDQDLQYIDQKLVTKLEGIRVSVGESISINSGYRCPAHNKEVGGAENSTHTAGLAADISPARRTLDDLDTLYDLCYNEFDNIGDGRNKGFIHVDERPPKKSGKRYWLYK